MKVRNLALVAGALIIGVAGTYVKAQGPLYDKVIVDLPYRVTVQNTTLEPGHYVIRQHSSADNSRVLQIFSNDGMKLETSVMTIPTLDNNTPENTKVVLHHYGNDYYFDKIWIQGKNYGYEFVLPDSVKAREKERMAPSTVAANYEAAPAESGNNTAAVNTAPSTTTTEEKSSTTTETQSTAAAPAAPAPDPAAPAPAPAATDNTPTTTDNNAVAQNQTPATPDQSSTANSGNLNQNQDAGNRSRSMPSTAANWLTMMLSGGFFAGAGMTLRRWAR